VPETHCFTSIPVSLLDRARVLAETVKRHHPNWTMWLCLVDAEPDGFELDPLGEDFDRVAHASELVNGSMLERILTHGAERVCYLDSAVALFNPLVHVEEALDSHSLVLTSHQDHLGFLAMRNDENGRHFSDWWARHSREVSDDAVPEDFFDGMHVLRNIGYNVASWNLADRPLSFTESGDILAGNELLRFFHFTKVDWSGELELARAARGHTEVFELLRWYRARLSTVRATHPSISTSAPAKSRPRP
jgi:hypothetical protein